MNQTDHPAQVLLERRGIRRSFRGWCEYRMSKVGRAPAKHHLLIIDTIERLLSGALGKSKVMFLMPPGSAKSTYTSVLLPAWFLNPEQHPTELMLACSYSYTLIQGFGKQARDIVEQESNVLGTTLSKSSQAADDWRVSFNNRNDGGYFCAGVGAGLAGHRARLGLIDDYIGSEEEADSAIMRDKVWAWYWNDYVPRLLPNAWQIIIANRRHEDDLVGRLLVDESDEWHIVKLPMLAEDNDPLGRAPGERLWPEWFTEDMVLKAKKLPRTWAGLYQQRPAPEEGNFFKKENILTYRINELPNIADLRIYGGSDWAVRKGTQSDRTVHLMGGMDSNGRLWILPDWFWSACDTLEAVNTMFDMQRKYKPVFWWHGRENITGAIEPFINLRMRETGTYVNIDELSESRDKESKASSIKARMASKMVMFPGFVPQWENALHELLTFPGGLHDDFVDALSKLGQGLDKMVAAPVVKTAWDGKIEDQRLTCGWLEKSHKRRARYTSLIRN